MTRPPWNDAMSDGCSVPEWLCRIIPVLREQCAALREDCIEHDKAYYYGGTEAERERADAKLRVAATLKVGEEWAEAWWNVIRVLGGSHWGTGRTWDGRALWEKQGTEAP